MARILFVLALLLLHPNNAKTNLTSILNILECTINSSDFWLVYETHFLLVEFLTILVLQTEQHKSDLNYFTEALLSEMNGYEFPVTLNIEEYFLSDPNENQTSRICDESIVDEIGGHNFEPVEYETLAKIKRLSSDSPKGVFHHSLGCGHASPIPRRQLSNCHTGSSSDVLAPFCLHLVRILSRRQVRIKRDHETLLDRLQCSQRDCTDAMLV
jgi:hypothetical protein